MFGRNFLFFGGILVPPGPPKPPLPAGTLPEPVLVLRYHSHKRFIDICSGITTVRSRPGAVVPLRNTLGS